MVINRKQFGIYLVCSILSLLAIQSPVGAKTISGNVDANQTKMICYLIWSVHFDTQHFKSVWYIQFNIQESILPVLPPDKKIPTLSHRS